MNYKKVEDRWEGDQAHAGGMSLDPTPLLGSWINTNDGTRGIRAVALGAQGNALTVRALGSPGLDWGEVPADFLYSDNLRSARAVGFLARYDFRDSESLLQANVSLGLLILATFDRVRNRGGLANSFSREFFRREMNTQTEPMLSGGSEARFSPRTGAPESTGSIDPTPFSGVWLNTNPATGGIAKVIMSAAGGGLSLRVQGAGDLPACDWGEVTADTFFDSIGAYGGVTFLAFYDFGFMETYLHAWIKLGVLVIAKFDRFKDESGRANRFSREFFYRAGGST